MIRSFIHAISGIAATVKSERNMRIHLAAAVAVVVFGVWLGLDGREWAKQNLRQPGHDQRVYALLDQS